jgi:hypothetical protein
VDIQGCILIAERYKGACEPNDLGVGGKRFPPIVALLNKLSSFFQGMNSFHHPLKEAIVTTLLWIMGETNAHLF